MLDAIHLIRNHPKQHHSDKKISWRLMKFRFGPIRRDLPVCTYTGSAQNTTEPYLHALHETN